MENETCENGEHHIWPMGEEYEVDGVAHQDVRCSKCKQEFTYYDGGDGSAHVKNKE